MFTTALTLFSTRSALRVAVPCLFVAALSGCDSESTAGSPEAESANKAEAAFKSAPNMNVSGDAQLRTTASGVEIHVEVEGVPPGEKGMHIHQTADCSDIPNKSMGSHFAPQAANHGLPNAAEHHLGDLGNIRINEDGKGTLDITVPGANLRRGDGMSFVGRSIVLHESNDKGTGESGDSGTPIACAPIEPS